MSGGRSGYIRTLFPGASASGESSGFADVIVAPSGGDYTHISTACTNEPVGTIIGVKPAAYTEIADIAMKSGQIVYALGGQGGDQVTVDMGVGFQWSHDGSNLISGLKIISSNADAAPLFDINGTNVTFEHIEIDASAYASQTVMFDSSSNFTTLKNIKITMNSAQATLLVSMIADYTYIEDFYATEVLNIVGQDTFYVRGSETTVKDVRIELADVLQPISETIVAAGPIGAPEENQVWQNITVIGPGANADNVAGFMTTLIENSKFINMDMSGVGLGLSVEQNTNYCYFCNIDIEADFGGIEVHGINLNPTSYNQFVNCRVRVDGGAVTDYGIYLYDRFVQHNHFTNCDFVLLGNGNAVNIDQAAGTTLVSYNSFVGCHIDDSGAASLAIALDGAFNQFTDCSFTGNQVTIAATSVGNRFDNCQNLDGANVTDAGVPTIFDGLYTPAAGGAPGVTNDVTDGFNKGDRWYDSITGITYECRSNATGAASWGVVAGGAGFDYVSVTEADSPVTCALSTQYDNIGATAAVTLNLPAATRGATIRFAVSVAQDMIITAAAGDVINVDGEPSSVAGTVTISEVGTIFEVTCLDGTNWYVTAAVGSLVPA